MAAPKENQFWKQRSKHGRNKLFDSPDMLWEQASEYFEWCDNNPWYKNEAVKAGDHFGENVRCPIQRPYSINGLCVFLDCDIETFNNYTKKKDFFGVCNKIREIIYTQQYEGAAVGAFNANIVARKINLKEESDHNVKVSGIKPIEWVTSKNVED